MNLDANEQRACRKCLGICFRVQKMLKKYQMMTSKLKSEF
jgi:hypothetical protein